MTHGHLKQSYCFMNAHFYRVKRGKLSYFLQAKGVTDKTSTNINGHI